MSFLSLTTIRLSDFNSHKAYQMQGKQKKETRDLKDCENVWKNNTTKTQKCKDF